MFDRMTVAVYSLYICLIEYVPCTGYDEGAMYRTPNCLLASKRTIHEFTVKADDPISSYRVVHQDAAFLGWKKVDILAIPLVLAFFNCSTPCEPFAAFFRFFSFAAVEVLLSFASILSILAARASAASSERAFRYVSRAAKLYIV